MNIDAPAFVQALTADGDATGYATVADNSGFFVGCIAYINNATSQKRCLITELVGTTKVGLRIVSEEFGTQSFPSYGSRSSLTGFTVASGSRLNMAAQLARIVNSWQRPLGAI